MLEKVNEGNDRYIALTRERERRAQPRDEIDCEWLQLQLDQERSWREDLEAELIALSTEVWLAEEQLQIAGVDTTDTNLREAIIALIQKIKGPSCETTPKESDNDLSATNNVDS